MKTTVIEPIPNSFLDAYAVPRHPAPIHLRLDGNEGVAPDETMLTPITPTLMNTLNRYPATKPLEASIAEVYGLEPDQVCVTAGGDDALYRLCRVFLNRSRSILLPTPTFEMLPRFAHWCEAPVATVPWSEPRYPIDAVIDAVDETTGIIAVVSPNNPTGGYATPEDLIKLSEAAPHAMIMVDCAYAEFADVDLTQTALELPNAVVFRTVSKALGLAGLRVGYALGAPKWIKAIRSVGMPYPVSALSLAVAEEAIRKTAMRKDFVNLVCEQRTQLIDKLQAVDLMPQPSQGNFVFARTPRALWWRDTMAALGISIRAWPDHAELDDAVRVTCPGSQSGFQALTHAIDTISGPQGILFDLDGVLADVSDSYRTAIKQTAQHFDVRVSDEDIEAIKQAGHANNDWIVTQRLLAQHGLDVALDQIQAIFDGLYWGSTGSPGLFQLETFLGSRAEFSTLADRYPVGIVTGRPRKDAIAFLERFQLLEAMDVIVTMEDAPAKPSPAPVQLAMKRLDIQRAWMLGDTPDDIVSARDAGVLPFGILPPKHKSETLETALLRSGAARVYPSWMNLLKELP